MQRALRMIAVAALATLAPAAAAAAQDVAGARAFRVGIQGGVSMPLGVLGDDDFEEGGGATMGFNVAGTLGFRPAALPVGLQFDLAYNRFGVDGDLLDQLEEGLSASYSILSGTANVMLEVPTQGGFRPYLIGGVGMYNYELKVSSTADDGISVSFDDSNVGLNGGIGFRFGFGTLGGRLEARYHTIFAEGERISFLPLAFGIDF